MMLDTLAARYAPLVDDPAAFAAALERLPPFAFRVNTLKASKSMIERFARYGLAIEPVAWYRDAFTAKQPVSATVEHALGHMYIQDLASMLPPLAVREELKHAQLVLDACAAPGSKTTQTAALMNNRGTLVANDDNYMRIKALKHNCEKTGALNTVITNMDLRRFPAMRFDIVLLDAPCSGEGLARKNDASLRLWSEKRIAHFARIQKEFILKAYDLLCPDGTLLYSTCTFAPEENEGVIQHLIDTRGAAIVPITIPHLPADRGIASWHGVSFDRVIRHGIRIWPHHVDTIGFFLAKITKEEPA